MQRTIVAGADLTSAALVEFKKWLGITRPDEDEMLTQLLEASLAMCEAFTGQMPLSQTVEERLPTQAGRYPLTSHPIQSLTSAELIAQDGTRSALDPDSYRFALQDASMASVELPMTLEGQAVAMRVNAGIASDWEALPAPLKQGVVRLAAYHYRDRDRDGSRSLPPPASVTALWRPWRLVRLT
jgi:uncharacterized phiE125 gp8 family phage protein